MAVIRMNEKTTLGLAFIDRLEGSQEIYVRTNLSGVDPDTTDQKLYDVAIALMGLSEKPLKDIYVRDSAELTE